MKRTLLFPFILAVLLLVPLGTAQESLCLNCEGVNLVYQVYYPNGLSYTFVVSPYATDVDGLGFYWFLAGNMSGQIEMTPQALAASEAMHNFFQDGSLVTLEESTSVWLSKDTFERLVADEVVTLDTGIGLKAFTVVNRHPSGEFFGQVDSRHFDLNSSPGYLVLRTDEDLSEIFVLNDPENPLILKMDLDGEGGFGVFLRTVLQ